MIKAQKYKKEKKSRRDKNEKFAFLLKLSSINVRPIRCDDKTSKDKCQFVERQNIEVPKRRRDRTSKSERIDFLHKNKEMANCLEYSFPTFFLFDFQAFEAPFDMSPSVLSVLSHGGFMKELIFLFTKRRTPFPESTSKSELLAPRRRAFTLVRAKLISTHYLEGDENACGRRAGIDSIIYGDLVGLETLHRFMALFRLFVDCGSAGNLLTD